MSSSKGTIRCPVSFANNFTLRFTSCLTLTNRVDPNAKICYCLDVHVYFLLVRICNCNIHVNWKHVFIYPHFAIGLDILSGGTVLVTHCFMCIGKFSSPKHTLFYDISGCCCCDSYAVYNCSLVTFLTSVVCLRKLTAGKWATEKIIYPQYAVFQQSVSDCNIERIFAGYNLHRFTSHTIVPHLHMHRLPKLKHDKHLCLSPLPIFCPIWQ